MHRRANRRERPSLPPPPPPFGRLKNRTHEARGTFPRRAPSGPSRSQEPQQEHLPTPNRSGVRQTLLPRIKGRDQNFLESFRRGAGGRSSRFANRLIIGRVMRRCHLPRCRVKDTALTIRFFLLSIMTFTVVASYNILRIHSINLRRSLPHEKTPSVRVEPLKPA